MKPINEQIEMFLRLSQVSAAQLSRASGVRQITISRLRLKKINDTVSLTADALRSAMIRLDPETARLAL